jgi:pyruvate/2-oxoacid:ferredoxin oxidoreductase beta subunit
MAAKPTQPISVEQNATCVKPTAEKPEAKPTDAAEQERLQQLYRQQQQRLACPGCGESPFLG